MFQRFAIAISCLGMCVGHLLADQHPSADEVEVKAFLQEFTDALNQKKIDAIDSYWTTDGEILLPLTGKAIRGDNDIVTYLKQKVENLKDKRVNFTAKTIEFPDANSATVQGIVQITDQGQIVEQAARKIELVKHDGNWYLYSIKEIKLDLPPSLAFEHLKELAWLLGTWKDTDENVTIEFKTDWDADKNFIKQLFTMKLYDQKTLEGLQIIGWNPITNTIVSWVFDSDGGHGNGAWEKQNGKWVVKYNYVLSDGKTASVTNIYAPINSKNYEFTSIDRKVDGKALPDISASTVVKED